MLSFFIKSKRFLLFFLIYIFSNYELNATEDYNNQESILIQIKNQIKEINIRIDNLSNEIENIKLQKNFNEEELDNESNNENQEYHLPNDELNEIDIENNHKNNNDIYQNTSLNGQSSLNFEGINNIEELYFHSMERFRSNNLEESQVLLEKILNSKFDDSEKNLEIKANSHFLMAEIFYKKPDFEKSASNFLKAYQVFSKINTNHIQAGNSLLRLGQTLYASGNKDAACKSFFKLNKDFKENPLVEISENEISKLKCIVK